MSSKQTAVHWFRKGLRVHDNPALAAAVDRVRGQPSKLVLRPVFILDPGIIRWLRVGPNRWRFLQQTLADLDANLRKLNSRLRFEFFVRRLKLTGLFSGCTWCVGIRSKCFRNCSGSGT